MTKFINQRFSPGESSGEAQTQESSKRQQCVRATELAKRTGLEIRYAGLSNRINDSGKAFDESGRRITRKGIVEEKNWKARYLKSGKNPASMSSGTRSLLKMSDEGKAGNRP